jgi:predicted KAP-like P-loop ATPase
MADAGKSHSSNNTDSQGIIKLLKDEPNENGNQFGFGTYSKVLSEIVENSPSPFAIGIFGGWGTGKTTLMRLMKETLKNNRKVLTVWFDPWRYENEEYLAVIPLLRTIRLSLQQFTDENQIDVEKSRWKKLKESLEFSMEAFLNSMTLKVGIQNVASVDIRGKEIVDSFKVKNLQHSEFMSEANTVFYHAIDYLEKALQNVLEEDKMFRIVVFIDDLDRC